MPGSASTPLRLAAQPHIAHTAELDRPNLPLVINSLALISFGLSSCNRPL